MTKFDSLIALIEESLDSVYEKESLAPNRPFSWGKFEYQNETFEVQFNYGKNHKRGFIRVGQKGEGTLLEIKVRVRDGIAELDESYNRSRVTGLKKHAERLFSEWLEEHYQVKFQNDTPDLPPHTERGEEITIEGITYITGDVTLNVPTDSVSHTPENSFYQDKIDEYVQRITDGEKLETLPVRVDGVNDFMLTDFNHRFAALKILGARNVLVEPVDKDSILMIQKNLKNYDLV